MDGSDSPKQRINGKGKPQPTHSPPHLFSLYSIFFLRKQAEEGEGTDGAAGHGRPALSGGHGREHGPLAPGAMATRSLGVRPPAAAAGARLPAAARQARGAGGAAPGRRPGRPEARAARPRRRPGQPEARVARLPTAADRPEARAARPSHGGARGLDWQRGQGRARASLGARLRWRARPCGAASLPRRTGLGARLRWRARLGDAASLPPAARPPWLAVTPLQRAEFRAKVELEAPTRRHSVPYVFRTSVAWSVRTLIFRMAARY